MDTVAVSSKFQIVIPKRLREALGLRPGQKVQAVHYGNRVGLVPAVPVTRLNGFLPGIDKDVPREDDRLRTSSTARDGSSTSPTDPTPVTTATRSSRSTNW